MTTLADIFEKFELFLSENKLEASMVTFEFTEEQHNRWNFTVALEMSRNSREGLTEVVDITVPAYHIFGIPVEFKVKKDA